MNTATNLLRTTILAAFAATLLAQTALANPINADPKNQWPFTRPVAVEPRIGAPLNADPKNEWPFTRPVAAAVNYPENGAPINADPKNEWPFTRKTSAEAATASPGWCQSLRVATSEWCTNLDPAIATAMRARADRTAQNDGAPLNADPKNVWPFTRQVTTSTTVSDSGGFDWTDGGIGLLAGIGIAVTALGARALGRKTRPLRTT